MLENYNSMVDLTGEGRVGNTPFLDAKWVLNPKSGSDVSLIPHLEFSGYLVDKLQAGGIDLINGFYAFFGGKAKTVEERRKQAEELRVKTLQFKDDGGIVNQAMESIGFLSEAAPTMAVTLPLAVGTSGLGLGIYATTGLIATEAATVTTIQEWGRVKNNPQWSIYSKNGEEFSYDAMMMATGGDPELMSQYTEDKNTAGKLGYLSNVFGTSMLTDGVTSLLFLKGLKGLSPYNAVTKDMSSWWRYHAASAGYAVPQGSVANSFASMQQYIAQQEALGREATWAEVKQVGYDAALAGGLTAATVSTIGSVSNLVLARDPFGRANGNMQFYSAEMQLLKDYEAAKTQTERNVINQKMMDLNRQNQYRLNSDEEFYSRIEGQDMQDLVLLSNEMNTKYRQLMQISNKDSPTAKALAKDIDGLKQRRDAIEEPYEAEMMVGAEGQPAVMGDDGTLIQPPIWAKDYTPKRPEPLEPLDIKKPQTVFEKTLEKVSGVKGMETYSELYTSLVDNLDAPRRLQKAIADQTGTIKLDQDLDIALRTVDSKAADQVEVARNLRAKTLLPVLRNMKVNKNTSGADLLPEGTKPTSLAMLDRYLYALHAPERNSAIYAKNQAELTDLKGIKDPSSAEKRRIKKLEEYMTTKNGSGMSDADAQAFIQSLDPEMVTQLDAAVKEVRGIQQHTRDLLFESGMISKEHYDFLNSNRIFYLDV